MQHYFRYLWIALLPWQCTAQHPAQDIPAPAASPASAWISTARDSALFAQKRAAIQSLPTASARALAAAQSFKGAPYVKGVLNRPDREALTLNLRELDCATLMDYALALAQSAVDTQPGFEGFARHVRRLRYYNDSIDGFGSRIHYFSAWIQNAEALGYVRDLTPQMGGMLYEKTIRYMSDHPGLYPPLKDPVELEKVKRAEAALNARPRYYIPKQAVPAMQHQIQTGDIVVFTSSQKNLDVEHEGFALRDKNGVLWLLHASTTGQKVTVAHRPLLTYLARYPAMSGLMVVRVVD